MSSDNNSNNNNNRKSEKWKKRPPNNRFKKNNEENKKRETPDSTYTEGDSKEIKNSNRGRNGYRGRGGRGGYRGGRGRGYNNKAISKNEDPNQLYEAKKEFNNNFGKQKTDFEQLEGYTSLACEIIHKLNSNNIDCLVCFETVKKQAYIWSCEKCYALFHIACIKKWARSESNVQNEDVDGHQWRCPGCQHTYIGRPACVCFCGKTKDPNYDSWLIPHSCGQICGKTRKDSTCTHKCNLPCHPGPCEKCNLPGIPYSCYCGDTQFTPICGEKIEGRSCGNTCGKELNCGLHYCQEECHPGECGKCNQLVEQICYCGKNIRSTFCGNGTLDVTNLIENDGERWYSCSEICEKPLSCGNHTCQDKCHSRKCKPCPLSPEVVTTCPCGSIPLNIERNTCLDPIPTCNSICRKTLPCGIHKCKQKCHTGPCNPCKEKVEIKCRCGSTKTTMICSKVDPNEPFVCKKKCNHMKSCGNHRCGIKCCSSANRKTSVDPFDSAGVHLCKELCNKLLPCGLHHCDQLCHKGKCPNCYEMILDEISCTCGKTVLEPPIRCGTKLPVCNHPCTVVRECGHQDAIPHNCHEGECPPCTAFTERICSGGHAMVPNVRCSQAEVCCGEICGKPMPCGIHTCRKICHMGPCVEGHIEGELILEPISCGQSCGAPLSGCEHTCKATCHPMSKCPNICKAKITVHCDCGRKSMQTFCTKYDPEKSGQNKYQFNSESLLECDETCAIEKRNRTLADAFGISSSSTTAPKYANSLLNFAKASPQFVLTLERMLSDFIKSPNSKMDLPPMDRIKRQIVHELARYYMLETQSMDYEPNRHVLISKKRDARVPSVLLSAYLSIDLSSVAKKQVSGQKFAIHLYDFDPSVKNEHIYKFLMPFANKYELQWIDDSNCLALFSTESDMKLAVHVLSNGTFKVKPYDDLSQAVSAKSYVGSSNLPGMVLTPQEVGWNSSYSENEKLNPWDWAEAIESSKSKEKQVKLTYQKPEQIWQKNDNLFSVLEENTKSIQEKKKKIDERPKLFSSVENWDQLDD